MAKNYNSKNPANYQFDPLNALDTDYQISIDIQFPDITILDWARTLGKDRLAEYERASAAHEAAIDQACRAGDAERVKNSDGSVSSVRWRDPDRHGHWMRSIPPDLHQLYHAYWDEYRQMLLKRNQ